MKNAIIFLLIFNQVLWASDFSPFSAIGNYFKKRKYKMTSSENNFAACSQFQKEDEEDYFATCNNQNQLIQNTNLRELYDDTNAIEKEVLRKDFLNRLQNKVVQTIDNKIGEVTNLQMCLEQNSCPKLRAGIIKGLRINLPKMRILMAQKNMPGKIYSPTRPIRFDREIDHDVLGADIPKVTDREAEFLHKYTWDLEDDFTDLVKLEHPEFANQPAIIDSYVSKKFEEQNKKYQTEYESLISSNPLLSLVNAHGQEDDEYLISEALKGLAHVQKSLIDLKEKKLEDDDQERLILFQVASNNLLNELDSAVYCDVASGVRDDQDFSELKEDLILAGAILAGGGACAYTFGLGCVVGVVVAGEGYAILSSVERQSLENDLFLIGESSVSELEGRNFERDLTMYLAPISILGEGAGLLVKRSFRTIGRLIDSPSEFKRFDFEQRQALEELEESLGLKKQRYNNYYNPGNELNLSTGDQIYFAGIIEELNKRGMKDADIKKYIRELMEECDGGAK